MQEFTNTATIRVGVRAHLEIPLCPFCGSSESRSVRRATDDWNPQSPAKDLVFEVHRCTVCGGHYTSPRFREESKHIPFRGGYPFYERARRCDTTVDHEALRPFLTRAGILQKVHPRPGRILDIGMGDGAFLALMRGTGWSVSGIDAE